MHRTLPQLLLAILVCVGPAGAQIATPEGVALSPFPVSQTPAAYQTFPDGDGGVWAVFQGAQAGAGLYAQHVDRDGGYAPGFNAAARLLAKAGTNVNGMWSAPDGVGGAVIVWFGSNAKDTTSKVTALRLLHVDALGNVPYPFPDTGAVVSTIAQVAMVVGDGLGGCYVAWQELKSVSNPDIVAQHYNGFGAPQWAPLGSPTGRNVCAVVGLQDLRAMQPDGTGGAYVVWADSRVSQTTPLYATRLVPSGVSGAPWTTNGIRITPVTTGIRIVGSATSATGGLWLAWRDIGVPSMFMAQHVDSSANLVWAQTGAVVATSTPVQAEFVAAGSGDVFVTWGGTDIRCSRLTAAGARAWPETNGRVLLTPVNGTANVHSASDGSGGLRLAWSFDNAGQTDVNTVRVTGTGDLWPGEPALGDTFATTPALEEPVAWFQPTTSTPVVAWLQAGVLRARRIPSGATLGVGPDGPRSPLALSPPSPNPLRAGPLALRFSAPAGPARLDLFDAAGRRMITRALYSDGGAQALRLDEAARLAPGVYTLRLAAAGHSAMQQLVRVQ